MTNPIHALSALLSVSCALAQTAAHVHLPVTFEQNTGALADEVRFLSRGGDFVLFLTANAQVLQLDAAAVSATFVGGAAAAVIGDARLPGAVHYYRGADATQWHTDVPLWSRVRYERVWDGIDVVFHGARRVLEYDFVVAPGAEPSVICLEFAGAERLELDATGDLLLHTAAGVVRHGAPIAWQDRDDGRRPVAARWVLDGTRARFELGTHDRALPLIIDPTIVYTTHIGGSGQDEGTRIEVDAQGCAHIVGGTGSVDFPTQNALQATIGGGNQDLFVTKLSADGSALMWSTYLGGEFAESDERDIVLLADGSVAVTGRTSSTQFPITGSAFQSFKNGAIDAFLTIIGPGGGLSYSTYYGGSGIDSGHAVAATGNTIYITGKTGSNNLPNAAGGFQSAPSGATTSLAPDGFVAAFDRASGQCTQATYLGGSTHNEVPFGLDAGAVGVAVFGQTKSTDFPTHNAFQAGHAGGTTDSFVVLLDLGLTAMQYGTYFGGAGNDSFASLSYTNGNIRIGPNGHLYIASDTNSNDLPVTANALQSARAGGADAFLARFDPTLSGAASLVYATYFGGSGLDLGEDLRIDAAGNVFFCGSTRSPDLPLVHAVQPLNDNDAFVAVLQADGTALRFCTTLGGLNQTTRGVGIALGPDDGVFVTGATSGLPGLPTTAGAFQETRQGQNDAWVARFDVPLASRANYGAGHPGTLGVPGIDTSADPILGTTIDILIDNSLGAPTLGAMAAGGPPTVIPTPFGGDLLLQPFATVTLPFAAGGGVIPLAIPADPAFCGVPFFLQGALFDAGASHGVAFTPGLQLDFGI